jgi:hypothetical protein
VSMKWAVMEFLAPQRTDRLGVASLVECGKEVGYVFRLRPTVFSRGLDQLFNESAHRDLSRVCNAFGAPISVIINFYYYLFHTLKLTAKRQRVKVRAAVEWGGMSNMGSMGERLSQIGASCGRNGHELAFTVSSKGNARFKVFTRKVRKIVQDFFFGHVRCQILQDLINSNSQTANAGFAATFVGVNRDVVLVVHEWRLRPAYS